MILKNTRGANHPLAKLDDEKVKDIRRRREAGESRESVGAMYGVSPYTVKNIEKRNRWKHVQ